MPSSVSSSNRTAPQLSLLVKEELLINWSAKKKHPLKAFSPMLVTPLPIVTDVKPLQPLKAPSPMLATLFGIVMEVRPQQPSKAFSPILITSSPRIISCIDDDPLNQLPTSLQWSVIEVRSLQPAYLQIALYQ